MNLNTRASILTIETWSVDVIIHEGFYYIQQATVVIFVGSERELLLHLIVPFSSTSIAKHVDFGFGL